MNEMWIYILGILAGVSITGFLIWKLQDFRETEAYIQSEKPLVRILKWEERQIGKLSQAVGKRLPIKDPEPLSWSTVIEIALIGAWAFWVGQAYLDLDPLVIPSGREFSSAIQTHHLWSRFGECGLCALWNGSVRGGYPAFADVHGSMLHPLVVLTTAIFGVVNGAKVSLVLSLWIGGVAQWWICKELELSWLPRLWASGMVIVAGHLTGNMELGAFGVVLSMAMASLVFGAILSVAKGKGNRAMVLMGLTLGSAMLAGQGYIQAGLLGTFPAIMALLLNHKMQIKKTWRDFALAFILAALISAVFLVPFMHFIPNFLKFMDPEFSAAQPFKYIPLNYVIDSYDFYQSTALGKLPFPHLYTLFIGWIPVLLAVYGLRSKKAPKAVKLYFLLSIVLLLGISSGDLLKLLTRVWEGAAGIRHPTQIAGLTIPLILGFAGLGLEKVIHLDWPKLDLTFQKGSPIEFQPITTRLLLIIPLVFSIYQGYQFSQHWLGTFTLNEEIFEVIDELKTDSLQWVQTPYGEHFYIEPAIKNGLKLSPGIMTWQWADRDFPKAHFEATHSGQPQDTVDLKSMINTIGIYTRPEVHYAVVKNESGETPCQASGIGGELIVVCDSAQNGRLIIQEYYWPGWKCWMNGTPMTVFGYPWISVEAPQGLHTFTFRYQPWDVPLGILLSAAGIVLSGVIWVSSRPVLDMILSGRHDKPEKSRPISKTATEKD